MFKTGECKTAIILLVLMNVTPATEALYTYIRQFSPINESAWEAFICLFTSTVLPKHALFAQPGNREHSIGFLLKGTVRSFYRNADGIEYNKTFHTAHSFIGAYSSLVSGGINLIAIQALEPCELLIADYRKIIGLYDEYPDLERFARKLAESYFVQKEKREIELVLLDAQERYQIFREEFPGLENLIPQYHIASYLGVTPTQLSRIRAKKPE